MHAPSSLHPVSPHQRHWPRVVAKSWDRDAPVLDLGRLWLGVVAASVGALYLLDAAGVLDAGKAIDRWWPLPIVAAGAVTLAERPPRVLRGTILTGIGVVLLLFTTDLLSQHAWSYLWPALLLAAGLVIIARWHGRTVPRGASEQDVVRSTAVFGGPKLACTSQQFTGAWLTAIFGGITVDLRGALPAVDGASINATVAFGGIDILVPQGWRISVRSTPIFGGVDDKTDHTQTPAPDAPTLHVDALTVFGGVAIKHEK